NCQTADSGKLVDVPAGSEFVCKECKGALIEIKKGGGLNKAIVVVVIVLLLGGLGFGVSKVFFSSAKKPSIQQPVTGKDTGQVEPPKDVAKDDVNPIKVCVVTWGGYAGGQYFNGGFKASKDSRYFKEFGLLVDFIVIDDFQNSRDAWKADKCDLLWITADAFTTEVASFKDYEPKIIFQADWSRGGDAIVVKRGIDTVEGLKGKKVAFAFGTPSHTFLLWLLAAGGLTYKDIEVVEAPSAVDAAMYFKAGKVDAAVVWSPDDEDCVKNVPGAKILRTTREASHIIADVFFAKASFIEKNRQRLVSLVKGWLIGAMEINTNEEARQKAVTILSEGLNQPEDFIKKAIANVRLTTYGDNLNFFNLDADYKGVKGEDLYTKMGKLYSDINLAPQQIPSWRNVVDLSILKEVKLSGAGHEPEAEATFNKATKDDEKAKPFATKRVTIVFSTASAELDDNAKYLIDSEFVPIAKSFANTRIRIEGNTDNVGTEEANQRLSQKRAQAVADYLIEKNGFTPTRIIVVGNGSKKPLGQNNTPDGRAKNRRTDFELLED
ncbi:MAG: phosphate ABC transporter substrate-binding/OmpA family protein, partial [Candidatus Magnetoovum sp. WYHC-5]|nr:phosphate ABC transporter substrate-binding/OmpA family protein [Candidatus Magnetoovum sp. WYHC-5]